ncbi:hypothetical protein ABB07_38620 [Streptomyces incarnatus]|uniref:NACHT domain-containing protein n=1 Tax=Streptomyces incarnatus TaxID=665007 RepID=A0ABM5TXG9_9ACTN|nr:ATP-binding protein [Streptomyces incarnatus]AKJ15750.1 hypothetical protein ABB07_38620 [Streptomyces incarnatus]
MTKVVRHPEGKERPRDAPWYTLYPRRWAMSVVAALGRRWRTFRTGREARRSIVPNLSWRRYFRLNFARFMRVYAYLCAALLVAWLGLGIYYSHSPPGKQSWFQAMQSSTWFATVSRFLGPVLVAGFVTSLFLLYWYHRTKEPIVDKARYSPHDLVPTAGTLIDRIVGRRELSQVIAQTLRNRRTRRPYLLVGGVGVGKTAVLVELTRMLAQQSAVPVPLHLRDMDADGELDFEKMARRRFAEEADQGVLASGQIDKTWRQLRLDDKAVVLADGLEEALLDDKHRDDRDNIIRRAIDRADRQKLPLVIASRPHAPLEGTRAVIADLEPLSEEAALEYLMREFGEVDERRLDWIVETAEVSESPIYLQITRLLQQRGLLEHMTLREESDRLDTRSHDCSTLRLWLLETYRRALEDGRIHDRLVMDREERRRTVWVASALACLGLLQDSLEVTFDDLIRTYADDRADDESSRRSRKAAARPEPASSATHGSRLTVSKAQRDAIWRVLRRQFGEPTWLNAKDYPNECQTEFARYAANGQLLGLVKGYERKVRFPHSIIQAYLGYRLLDDMDTDQICEIVKPALRSPGPSRELLIALVLLSRQRAAPRGAAVDAPYAAPGRQPAPASPGRGPSARIPQLLRAEAQCRQDPKFFDLYAAALEIDSVHPKTEQDGIARELAELWLNKEIRGDHRTLEDAKLRLVRRFGAALREREDRSVERARLSPGRTPQQPLLRYRADSKLRLVHKFGAALRERTGRTPKRPLLPYWELFDIGTHEPSHPVRTAITHQIAAGGDGAFYALRRAFPLGSDPVLQYLRQTREAKKHMDDAYTAWLTEEDTNLPASRQQEEDRRQQHRKLEEEFEKKRAESWRYFAMRAWLVPMFVGSVSDTYRDEAKERLAIWLQHLVPAARQPNPLMPRAARGEPNLPLSMENALAQGFKNAANRRRRHPNACDQTRPYLVKQAEKMLTCSRYWYAQLSLLHALCLWALPDCIRCAPAPTETDRRRRIHRARTSTAPDGVGGTAQPRHATDPVQSVGRWLAMAGTAHDTDPPGGAARERRDRLLHPFVAEAGDLVTLALETGHPERFIWIDENGANDNVGSTPADPERYRKHNLWIAPSVGWSILHPRAQRLLADVLIMINLTERNGSPDDIEERLKRANKATLPPCLTKDRTPLHPLSSVTTADRDESGSTCLPTCQFRLCPYPPKTGKTQTEMEEPFCRQQQQLLHSGFRLRRPTVIRHTAPWVSIPVRELHVFWEEMANRNRKTTADNTFSDRDPP